MNENAKKIGIFSAVVAVALAGAACRNQGRLDPEKNGCYPYSGLYSLSPDDFKGEKGAIQAEKTTCIGKDVNPETVVGCPLQTKLTLNGGTRNGYLVPGTCGLKR